MLMKIFLSRSHPAPDVTLRLVRIQHLTGFPGKGRVDLEEPFGNILMYRTLADPELLRCLPHRRAVFYNIICNLHGPLLNIIFQKNPPANIVFTMYAGGRKVMLVYFSPLYLKLHIIFIFLTVSKIYFVFKIPSGLILHFAYNSCISRALHSLQDRINFYRLAFFQAG